MDLLPTEVLLIIFEKYCWLPDVECVRGTCKTLHNAVTEAQKNVMAIRYLSSNVIKRNPIALCMDVYPKLLPKLLMYGVDQSETKGSKTSNVCELPLRYWMNIPYSTMWHLLLAKTFHVHPESYPKTLLYFLKTNQLHHALLLWYALNPRDNEKTSAWYYAIYKAFTYNIVEPGRHYNSQYASFFVELMECSLDSYIFFNLALLSRRPSNSDLYFLVHRLRTGSLSTNATRILAYLIWLHQEPHYLTEFKTHPSNLHLIVEEMSDRQKNDNNSFVLLSRIMRGNAVYRVDHSVIQGMIERGWMLGLACLSVGYQRYGRGSERIHQEMLNSSNINISLQDLYSLLLMIREDKTQSTSVLFIKNSVGILSRYINSDEIFLNAAKYSPDECKIWEIIKELLLYKRQHVLSSILLKTRHTLSLTPSMVEELYDLMPNFEAETLNNIAIKSMMTELLMSVDFEEE